MNQLQKYGLIFLFVSVTNMLVAQTDSFPTTKPIYPIDPYDKELKTGFLLRGKAIYWGIVEDLFWLNYSVGAEFRFLENHSLGVDYIFFETFQEQEQYNDTINLENYDEYRQKYPRHSLNVDYRYYFANWGLFEYSLVTPYINVFGRYGKAGIFAESEFDYRDGDIVRQWETFYDVGSALGVHIGDDWWGLDVNIGACKRFKTEDIARYSITNGIEYEYGLKSSAIKPVMRVNLFFYLFTKR